MAKGIGVEVLPLDDVLSQSDVVSLHLPVNEHTEGMIAARELALLKDGAVFINSARAALCDEPALIEALQQRPLQAYLDVFATEPLLADHPFRNMDNVCITPHFAGDNRAMFQRCAREAILSIKDHFDGKKVESKQYVSP